jgi:hypothetical protein
MLIENATHLRDHLIADLGESCPDLLDKYPPNGYIAFLDAYPPLASYLHVSDEIRNCCDSILREAGVPALETYHKLVLVTLILRAWERLERSQLPADIPSLYRENFARIISDIDTGREEPGFYQYPTFCKELALCTMRLIPAGPQKICLRGLPRSWFLRKRPGELLRATRLLLNLGGFRPVYEMHTDSRDLPALRTSTPDGWRQFYRRVAALLDRQPAVRGVAGTGWFFDPQLERISPELAYLRQLVAGNGGTVLCLGPCRAHEIKNATQLSAARRQLYLEGKYRPFNYLAVWPRKPLLAWARAS